MGILDSKTNANKTNKKAILFINLFYDQFGGEHMIYLSL